MFILLLLLMQLLFFFNCNIFRKDADDLFEVLVNSIVDNLNLVKGKSEYLKLSIMVEQLLAKVPDSY